ncbi:MAG: putative Flp pilus assembly CpaB [Rhodocyclaceae bacterium]|nr:putative Flp pilus assembly CpaB [Rhodocyclaceae bacterium]
MTWLLRGLAIVFALGAIIAGLIGYRLSTQPPPAPAPAAPTVSAIHSLKPLAAGQPIRAEDVALQPVASKPADSFGAPTQVVGRKPLTDIPAGQILTQAHFPSTSGHLQPGLRSGERAVAIKVDEVVGLGGFAQPGDRVDVLLFLRGSQETGNASSAQVVLSGVRLLAFGEAVQIPEGGDSEGVASRTAEKVSGRPRTVGSAVLAVPESAAARLMLAANSGALRLSLRPAEANATAPAEAAHLIRLGELAQAAPAPRPGQVQAPAPAARPAPAPRQTDTILIHEGDAVRTIGAPR